MPHEDEKPRTVPLDVAVGDIVISDYKITAEVIEVWDSKHTANGVQSVNPMMKILFRHGGTHLVSRLSPLWDVHKKVEPKPAENFEGWF